MLIPATMIEEKKIGLAVTGNVMIVSLHPGFSGLHSKNGLKLKSDMALLADWFCWFWSDLMNQAKLSRPWFNRGQF